MTNEEAIEIMLDYSPKNTEAHDAIRLAISAIERDRWISVEERLPVYGEKCLVAFKLNGHNDWFCAVVSMPEFIREAKAFYKETYNAMEGGHIDG